MLDKFLNSNEWQWRLARTILQGVLGVLAANLDVIVGGIPFDPTQKALIVALVMAVLSPVMKALGDLIDDKDADMYLDYIAALEDEEDEANGRSDV